MPAREVFFSEENLRGSQPVLGEALLVKIHQPALSDRSERLFLHERSVRRTDLQSVRAKRNSAGRYDDDLATGQPCRGHVVDERENPVAGDVAAVVEEQIGAKLHHDAPGLSQSGPHTDAIL